MRSQMAVMLILLGVALAAGCGGSGGGGGAGSESAAGLGHLTVRVDTGPDRVEVRGDEVLLQVSSRPSFLRVELFADQIRVVLREFDLDGVSVVSVPGIPPGKYRLVLTGLDSDQRPQSRFETHVEVAAGRSTDVLASLTPIASPSPSPTPSPTPSPSPSPSPPPATNYVITTHYDNDQLSVFAVNDSTGVLTRLGGAASQPGPWEIHRFPENGEFFLVTNSDADSLSVFRFDPSTGTLAQHGAPIPAGDEPLGLAFHVNRFCYAINQNSNTVNAYSYDPVDGTLTPLSPPSYAVMGVDVGAGGPGAEGSGSPPVAIAEGFVVNDTLFVSDAGAPALYGFNINPSTGALTGIAVPTPAAVPLNFSDDDPNDLVFVSLFTSSPNSGVDVFRFNAVTGDLTRTETEHFGNGVCGVLFDDDRGLLYAAGESDDTLYSLSVNGTAGTISPIDSASTGPPGSGACKMVRLGDLLYVANLGSNLPPSPITVPGSVGAFKVDNSGNLVPIPGMPFSAETSPGAGDNRNVHGIASFSAGAQQVP